MLKAIAFTFAVVGAATALPAAAQSPASASTGASTPAQRVQQIVSLTQPFHQVDAAAMDVVASASPRMTEAKAMAARGASQTEINNWMASWAPQLQRRMSDLGAMERALPKLNAADVRRVVGAANVTGQYDELVLSYPATCHDEVAVVRAVVNDLVRYLPAVAKGDEKAVRTVTARLLSAVNLANRTQQTNLRLSLAGIESNHPEHAFIESLGSALDAIMEIMPVAADIIEGKTVDGKGIAAHMRDEIEEGRKAADQVSPLSRAMLASIGPISSAPDPVLAERITRAFASYPDSATTLQQLFYKLDALATSFEGSITLEQVQTSYRSINDLVLALIEQSRQRRAFAAG
jgi:hypothetical protein